MSKLDHFLEEHQLAALIGPRTRDVANAFLKHGPLTVPQLQNELGLASKTLYYQVSKLLKVGLLSASDTDPVVYEAIATNFRMPPGFQGARYEELAAKSVEAGLKKAIRNFKSCAQRAPAEPEIVDDLYYLVGSLKLVAETRLAFQQELRDLLARYSSGDGREVPYVFVHSPRIDP